MKYISEIVAWEQIVRSFKGSSEDSECFLWTVRSHRWFLRDSKFIYSTNTCLMSSPVVSLFQAPGLKWPKEAKTPKYGADFIMRETDGQATSYTRMQRVIRASEKRKEKSGCLEKRVVPPLHRVREGLSGGARDSLRSQREPGYPRDLLPVPLDQALWAF